MYQSKISQLVFPIWKSKHISRIRYLGSLETNCWIRPKLCGEFLQKVKINQNISLNNMVNKNKIKSVFKHPFVKPFTGEKVIPTVEEMLAIELSNGIREKPDWKTKYKNQEILDKWAKESKEQWGQKTRYPDALFDYVIKELSWYEELEDDFPDFKENGFVIRAIGDMVVTSDQAVADKTRESLAKLSQSLRSSFADLDYHPGSNGQVIDLVHPSLYPVVYGKTRDYNGKVIEFSKNLLVLGPGEPMENEYCSEQFQWLPAEFKYNKSEEKFKINSYINNLHPAKFAELYSTIETVFNAAIPGLNLVLSRSQSPRIERIHVPDYDKIYKPSFYDYQDQLYDLDNDNFGELLDAKKRDYLADWEPKYEGNPITNILSLQKELPTLKVIVKMADIELTPEKPTYPGGSWHIEGTVNENIVATVLYYYEVENISESKLSFKESFDDPEYPQGDVWMCENVFGIADEQELTKFLGSITIHAKDLLIFPNTYQHHVEPFELVDKTKNGHRKILCFFLVDPMNKVVKSSADVPPQQKDWYTEGYKDHEFIKVDPKVAQDIVADDYNTIEQMKKYRDELMEERGPKEPDYESTVGRLFSLCEH